MGIINSALNFGLFSVSKKIGPVNIVLDKVFRKSGPTQEEAEALAAANDAARVRRVNETGNLPGWPFRNHAENLRRTNSIERAMVIPRMKYTFVVEFRIDQDWLNSGHMITNLNSGHIIRDGKIYIPLKSIDHPQVNFEVETLRSANRYVKVPKRMEYQPATVVFDDDITSMIAALRKEYIHFYHYAGDVGQKMGTEQRANLDVDKAWDEFQYESTGLVAPLGEQNRSRMTEHPSIGLKMRSDCSKHFFKEIVIYDLGMHPDSINAYYFYHPVVTSWTQDNLDYEDRQSKMTMSMQFEYESYYDVIGQNNSKVEGILFQMFGVVPTPVPIDPSDHAAMIDPSAADQELSICSAQAPAGSVTPNNPDPTCEQTEEDVEELQKQLQRLDNKNNFGSTGALNPDAKARQEELNEQLQAANDCVQSKKDCPPGETVDAAERTIDKASSEIEADCNERNANTILGADQAIFLERTDDDIIGDTCAAAGSGCTALNDLQQTQVQAVQQGQAAIGSINNNIADTQFELDQTPFTDPTRIAQLEQEIADLEENRAEIEEATEVAQNAVGLTSSERTMQQCTAAGGSNRGQVSDVAAASGADPVKCRAAAKDKAGITATDRNAISSDSNAITGQARDSASAQLQALSEEQTESLEDAEVASNDVEILENMQQSGGTEGSQNLSRESLELLQENGGDIQGAVAQRKEDENAARTNAESLNDEIAPLAGALNATGGPTPQPPPDPEPVQRVESQQRLAGEAINSRSKLISATIKEGEAKRDQQLLNMIEGGNTGSVDLLSAPVQLEYRTNGLDSARLFAEEREDLAQLDISDSTAELLELDAKVKAP